MTDNTILIVDDNHVNLKLIKDILLFEGYAVVTASDAESVLPIVVETKPQLILMDIQLPKMDGLTLTRILKKNEKTKHIPVVALTSFAMKGDDQKAFDAGCDGYITKPIDTRELPVIVKKFFSDKHSQQ